MKQQDSTPAVEDHGTLTVQARVDGFRRAGRAWSAEPTTVQVADFTPEQIAALRSDPALIVR